MKLPLSAHCHSLRLMLTIILTLLLLAAGSSVWAGPSEPQATGMLVTWDENCPAPPEGARVALDYAATIWGGLLTTPVPIGVRACWSSSVPAGALATGDATSYVRNFAGAPLADTYYPIALANALTGQDLLPSDQEISLKFKQDANWSFVTDAAEPGRDDFVTVALHEIAHGLGFGGGMYESYSVGFCGNGPQLTLRCPTPYDRFVVDSSGTALLSMLTPDPRLLGTRLRSDAGFGGPNVGASNGGTPARLYTPARWEQGSSLSHLDPTIFGVGVNALMLPAVGPALRHPGPLTLAIFRDLGWTIADGNAALRLEGPVALPAGQSRSFTARLTWPAYAAQPLTYAWSASDQQPVTHTAPELANALAFTWSEPGLKRISVTASGAGATVSSTRLVLVFAAGVSGPARGVTGRAYNFSATLVPADTALPVSYRWQAGNQAEVRHPERGTSDAAGFTWAEPGSYTVTVTAAIGDETVQAVHTIQIEGASSYRRYLPAIITP